MPCLDSTVLAFSGTGDVIYARGRRSAESDSLALSSLTSRHSARHPLQKAFRTVDAVAFSEIATVQVERIVVDLAVEPGDDLLALVTVERPESDLVSSVRVYEVGRQPALDGDSDLEGDEGGDEGGSSDDDDDPDEDDDMMSDSDLSDLLAGDDDDDEATPAGPGRRRWRAGGGGAGGRDGDGQQAAAEGDGAAAAAAGGAGSGDDEDEDGEEWDDDDDGNPLDDEDALAALMDALGPEGLAAGEAAAFLEDDDGDIITDDEDDSDEDDNDEDDESSGEYETDDGEGDE